MRKSLAVVGWLLATAVTMAGAEFLTNLSPTEKTEAGLQKLTADELARLEALVERYKSGESAAGRQGKEPPPVAAQRTTRETGQAAAASPGKPEGSVLGGWLKKIRLKPGTQVEYETVGSRIAGEFTGWARHTVFTLENGQRWTLANPDEHDTGILMSPKVRIEPAATGAFWMSVEGVKRRVRVKPYGVQ